MLEITPKQEVYGSVWILKQSLSHAITNSTKVEKNICSSLYFWLHLKVFKIHSLTLKGRQFFCV